MLTQCPHCRQVYEVPDDIPLKTELQCPSCQNKFLLKPYSEGGRNSISANACGNYFFDILEKPLIWTRILIILGIAGILIGLIGLLAATIFAASDNLPTRISARWWQAVFSYSFLGCVLLTCISSILSGVIRAVLETRDNTKAIRELLTRNLENK